MLGSTRAPAQHGYLAWAERPLGAPAGPPGTTSGFGDAFPHTQGIPFSNQTLTLTMESWIGGSTGRAQVWGFAKTEVQILPLPPPSHGSAPLVGGRTHFPGQPLRSCKCWYQCTTRYLHRPTPRRLYRPLAQHRVQEVSRHQGALFADPTAQATTTARPGKDKGTTGTCPCQPRPSPSPRPGSPGPGWEGQRAHTFGRLEETDAGLNLGPVDVLLVRCVLYHQLEQLHGDDVVIVCRTDSQLRRGLSP